MSVLRQSALRAPCDECRRLFDPTFGGICSRCGRLLCADHLYGSLWQRVRGMIGLRATCLRCRAGSG